MDLMSWLSGLGENDEVEIWGDVTDDGGGRVYVGSDVWGNKSD